MAQRAHASPGEDVQVVERGLLGLTAAVCLQAGVMSALVGDPLAIIIVPAFVVLALLARGSIVPAAYVGGAAWTLLLPHAAGVAVIVPLGLAVGCLAIAIGPGRMLDWVREDWGGRESPDDASRGWFEEELRP